VSKNACFLSSDIISILLGSTSHYLVQKSSVPVMVARRRMYRPLRHTSPDKLRHSPRVSLASANIEKTASKRQEDDIVDAADEEEADAAAKAAAAKKQQS
jgi:ribosomal protein S7